MCGICGFISTEPKSREMLIKMNNMLQHRGPDDHGEEIYALSNSWWCGLAQRRLSIFDLSENGHQPMHSKDRRVSVVFNGEIYNFRELRKEMPDFEFKTTCDTEIIIAAYLKWGIQFVDRLNGMFAIALLDRETDSLYLIRDRIGKKPLYYYMGKSTEIIFASELKAIRQFPDFASCIDNDIVGKFLHKQYIASPNTIYKDTYKLEPGTILKICCGNVSKWKYWDISEKYNVLKNYKINNYEEAKYELHELLKKSIKSRLMADVPVGAFLSGGYDSSLVCAIAQAISEKPIQTFCIGFNDAKLNEAVYAKKVAEHLGTIHEELYISEEEMLSLVESIPIYYDEPFADPSEIPSMLVSAMAKKKVSVVLSGDGGDEFFCGYNIYSKLQQAQKKALLGKILYIIRSIPGINSMNIWSRMPILYRMISDDLNVEAKTQIGVSNYINKINKMLVCKADNFYYEFESKYKEKRYDITRMLLDMDTYLPDDILTKIDRASMKYALECRCPILDKEIMEFSFRLPIEFKNNSVKQKRILKDITYEYIPQEIMDRPKAGFQVPLDNWLRGPLKEKLLDWTGKDYLLKQGIFEPDVTMQFVSEYLKEGDKGKWSGQNYSKICWPYFIFQQWYDTYMRNDFKV